MVPKICSIDECEKNVLARGWCSMHYEKWRTHGDPAYQRVVDRSCSVNGCDRPRKAKALCEFHYRRLRAFGDPMLRRNPESIRQCSVEGCGRKYRCSGYCGLHYARFRESNNPGPRETKIMTDRPECRVDGCDDPTRSRNLCGRHYSRWLTHGEESLGWVLSGDSGYIPTYELVHYRMRNKKGSAGLHQCINCDSRAQQWAYQHGDPNPLVSDRGLLYSTDPEMYEPMCISCHRRLDIQARQAA